MEVAAAAPSRRGLAHIYVHVRIQRSPPLVQHVHVHAYAYTPRTYGARAARMQAYILGNIIGSAPHASFFLQTTVAQPKQPKDTRTWDTLFAPGCLGHDCQWGVTGLSGESVGTRGQWPSLKSIFFLQQRKDILFSTSLPDGPHSKYSRNERGHELNLLRRHRPGRAEGEVPAAGDGLLHRPLVRGAALPAFFVIDGGAHCRRPWGAPSPGVARL